MGKTLLISRDLILVNCFFLVTTTILDAANVYWVPPIHSRKFITSTLALEIASDLKQCLRTNVLRQMVEYHYKLVLIIHV